MIGLWALCYAGLTICIIGWYTSAEENEYGQPVKHRPIHHLWILAGLPFLVALVHLSERIMESV